MTATLAQASTPPSLVTLLTRQRDLYRQLQALSAQQASLIEQGQTDQLLSVLAHRQRLVDALTELNRELAPIRDSAAEIATPQRAQVRSLMDEVDALLGQIIAQDDRDRQTLQAAQQDVGAQARQIRRGGAAVNAYRGGPSSHAPRFTDRQG